MSNPWFRLYAEFANDPKVQILSEQDQRRLVMVFCLRCNGCVTLQDKHVTFQLRITPQEWAITKAEFIANGFIDSENNVLNWDKRQYVSDSSKTRVARHRTLHKDDNVTPVTLCNVTVTPPEQNRTEQIQSRTDIKSSSAIGIAGVEYSKQFLTFWDMYPNRKNKGSAYKAFKKLLPADYPAVKAGLEAAKQSQSWMKDNGQYIPHPASWLNARGWEDDTGQSAEYSPEDFMKRMGAK